MKQVVHAACPHDCPDACGVLITVEDGRATKIQGDPGHPVTRGFLCAKVAKYLDRVYSPDRVQHPMRRISAKGPVVGQRSFAPPGQPGAAVLTRAIPTPTWQRISWDEALEEIASRFRAIAAEFGSEAILPYSYGGTLGTLNGASMDRRFFYRLGASQLERTICSTAGEAGLKSVLGVKLGTEPARFPGEARRLARKSLPIWSCSVWGLPCPPHYCGGGGLFSPPFFLSFSLRPSGLV